MSNSTGDSNYPPIEVRQGIIGEFIDAADPHTEADPWGVLFHVLAFVGNVVGRGPHFRVEATDHYPNLFVVLVGPTAVGRKGTAAGYPKAMLKVADPIFVEKRIATGLSSGEGVIQFIRDPVKGTKNGEEVIIDNGVTDKRMVVLDGEFAGTLKVMRREGNTLSPIIRNAWDGNSLESLTKSSNIRCSEPHVSIIAHITKGELLSMLNSTEIGNGFGNRFLFAAVKRSKMLPLGGNFLDSPEFADLAERLKSKILMAKMSGRITLSPEAEEDWRLLYPLISNPQAGIVGSLSARAAPQILRIALIYAMLDNKPQIERAHLAAAEKIWDYCSESLLDIFGDSFGDKYTDDIFGWLDQSPYGLSRTDIRDKFDRNARGSDISASLKILKDARLADCVKVRTDGRPREIWFGLTHKQTTFNFYNLDENGEEVTDESVLEH